MIHTVPCALFSILDEENLKQENENKRIQGKKIDLIIITAIIDFFVVGVNM